MTCNMQNVGGSSNTINTRYRGQKRDIRNEKDHPVTTQYNTYNHTVNDYTIIAVDHETNKNMRLRLEEVWKTLKDTLFSRD